MPELPEVETMVRGLRTVRGKTVARAWSDWPSLFRNSTKAAALRRLVGSRISDIRRIGKHVVFRMTKDARDYMMAFHPKMTGRPVIGSFSLPSKAKHIHLILMFREGGALAFEDARKFARVRFANHATLAEVLGVGPDPLAKGFSLLKVVRARPRKRIKGLLMDQSAVAGIGNIYADESLWVARIHPARRADSLSDKEVTALKEALVSILRAAIKHKGSSVRTYRTVDGRKGGFAKLHSVYNRKGMPCLRCGTAIKSLRLGGRTTHICPNCQKQ